MKSAIGVGVIGGAIGSWAAKSHLPALKELSGFALRAVSTTRAESAAKAADAYGADSSYADPRQLIDDDGVDLVMISVRVPAHADLVRLAISAGKSVFCEWPLAVSTAEAEALASAAAAAGVTAVVGLQARSTSEVRYVRDLIANGSIGKVLSTSLIGSAAGWGGVTEASSRWTHEAGSGGDLLTIPFAHSLDAISSCLGALMSVDAITAIRRERTRIAGTGEEFESVVPDQLSIAGIIGDGVVFSAHYRGGLSAATNLLWEIDGTEGAIRVTGESGHMQTAILNVELARSGETLRAVEPPPEYRSAPPGLTRRATNAIEYLTRLESDLLTGTSTVPSFEDAVRRHQTIDSIRRAAETGIRQQIAVDR